MISHVLEIFDSFVFFLFVFGLIVFGLYYIGLFASFCVISRAVYVF